MLAVLVHTGHISETMLIMLDRATGAPLMDAYKVSLADFRRANERISPIESKVNQLNWASSDMIWLVTGIDRSSPRIDYNWAQNAAK